tara:strand:+ start:190 stop:948 length:759 start_codon:yes stop_codon:yes gene_type:complete
MNCSSKDSKSNTVINLMRDHRSIRQYAPKEIPQEDLNAAIEAGQKAATSHNVQAYSVIQVTDEEKRKAIVEISGSQEKVVKSGAFLIFCGDTRRHQLICKQFSIEYSAKFEAFLVSIIDTALMSQNVALALESMGYGICYIGGIRNQLKELKELLSLPQGVLPLFGMCAGIPNEDPWLRPRLPKESIFFKDKYPEDQEILKMIDDYDKKMADYYKKRGASSRSWIPVIKDKFKNIRRPEIADFYKSQGASLE